MTKKKKMHQYQNKQNYKSTDGSKTKRENKKMNFFSSLIDFFSISFAYNINKTKYNLVKDNNKITMANRNYNDCKKNK